MQRIENLKRKADEIKQRPEKKQRLDNDNEKSYSNLLKRRDGTSVPENTPIRQDNKRYFATINGREEEVFTIDKIRHQRLKRANGKLIPAGTPFRQDNNRFFATINGNEEEVITSRKFSETRLVRIDGTDIPAGTPFRQDNKRFFATFNNIEEEVYTSRKFSDKRSTDKKSLKHKRKKQTKEAAIPQLNIQPVKEKPFFSASSDPKKDDFLTQKMRELKKKIIADTKKTSAVNNPPELFTEEEYKLISDAFDLELENEFNSQNMVLADNYVQENQEDNGIFFRTPGPYSPTLFIAKANDNDLMEMDVSFSADQQPNDDIQEKEKGFDVSKFFHGQ